MTTKTAKPTCVRLRAYNVGFGDWVLLTVTYSEPLPDGRSERHMLVELGTTAAMDSGPSPADIAALIEQHCSGGLDVVVATHRHLDHVSGFGVNKVGHILDRLQPGLVIRPRTAVPQKRSGAMAVLEAFDDAGRAKFVQTGDVVKMDKEMPGVKVQVLGPPPPADVPDLTPNANASDDYWLQMAINGATAPAIVAADPESVRHALDVLAAPGGMGAAAWLVRSLNDETIPHGLEMIEGFDDVVDNTNVILLVTIGKRTLLLAGDAPAENWSLTLETALGTNGRRPNVTLRRQMADIDVYMVGQHGSRDATPTSLYKLWKPRAGSTHPLVSILTTKRRVFDKSGQAKVPKPSLVNDLAALGALYITDDLPPDVWWMDIESPTVGNANFAFSQGPPTS